MRWFLERISSQSLPILFGNRARKEHESDFDLLVKKKVLVRAGNLEEVDCELCEDGHQCQLREDNGRLFYVCDNGAGKKELLDKDVAIFQYDDAAFRQLIASELGLKTNGTTTQDAHYIGHYQGGKVKTKTFYLRTNDDARGDFGSGPRVLISNINVAGEEDGVFYCALSDIIATSSSKNTFDKTTFEKCVSGAKRVAFDKKNRQLYLDGKRIYTASLKGVDFYFLLYLWDNWEKQLPYGDIHRFVRDKMGKNSQTDWADTAQKFCQKVKSDIKKSCKTIDKVITKPTTGHYMMADPLA